MSYQKTIIRPLFTEKMSRLEESEQKYAFQVMKGVNKIEIKRAIEDKFDVEVAKVATRSDHSNPRQSCQLEESYRYIKRRS